MCNGVKVYFNHKQTFRTVYNTNNMLYIEPKQHEIREGQFKYFDSVAGELDNNKRMEVISEYERKIVFEP